MPASALMMVALVLVTVAAASTVNAPAAPRGTGAGSDAWAGEMGWRTTHAPRSINEARRCRAPQGVNVRSLP
jgi:hypothetical protein